MIAVKFTRYFRLLNTYLRPQWPWVVVLAVALFSGIALQLAGPQILRAFLDAAMGEGEMKQLVHMALAFLGVGLAQQMVSAVATYFGAQVGWTATNQLRADLGHHCLGQDMAFHNERTPGQMIERVDGDVTNLSNFFSQFIIQIVGGIVLCLGVLGLLYREDIRAGVILTLFAIMALLVLTRYRNVAVAAAERTREASSRLFGFIEERLNGLEDIRANGGGGYVLDGFYRVNHVFFHASRKSWMLQTVLFMLIMALFTVGHALAIGTGVFLYQEGAITLGTVFLFMHYMGMLRTPLEQITRQLQDLQNATAGIARIDELLNIQRQMNDGPGVETLPQPPAVVFDGVTFAYREETVLKNISFTVEEGRSLGLIGRTGSGKTTIARLLYRLYEPQQGVVSLGGTNVNQFVLSDLRRRIGMVTQDVQIFDATVRDNLNFFDPTITDERIQQVSLDLGIGPWFEHLPRGLDTPLESGGGNLSAGEAQLLAFIRIFLRNPSLVILDEPSSRMDPVTEQLVKQAIRRLLSDRTAILIAHRLTTLQMVDDILLLDGGEVVEFGKRSVLAKDTNSLYHKLLHTDEEGGVL